MGYALRSKSGLLKRRFPAPARRSVALGDVLGNNVPSNAATYFDYRAGCKGRFFFDPGELPLPERLGELMGPDGRERTIRIADDFARGRFFYFSRQTHDHGWPPDWLLNPLTGGRHEARTHWCDYATFSPTRGDIKEVWEPSRFACAYWLVRAYALTGDEKYARAFWELFESWCEQNPPNRGPNWKCGQEMSIRVFAWCFALHGFWRSRETTPQRVAEMVTSIALQAQRIAGNNDYAVSQKNNHGISEAVGLLTVGLLFPELRGADDWRREGLRIFEREVLRQVYADGAFVQHSMNYHRVLLHDCLWAVRLADQCREPISEEVRRRIAAAAEFLFQMHDPVSGRVPNYGANDGALLFPLDACDYLDYRPTIQAACYVVERRRVFHRGPWDETLLWLFGTAALDAPQANRAPQSTRFDQGGYYTLRSGQTWGLIRCHTYRDRPMHVDLLHLDLWHRGVNVLGDSGSYKYFIADSPALEHFFKDITAHNTIEIDGRSPLELFTRFTWLPWPRGQCLEYSPSHFVGEHGAYEQDPWRVTHRRRVRIAREGRWEVTDEVQGAGSHQLTLRWNLPDVPYTFEREAARLRLDAPCGPVVIEIAGPEGLALDIRRGKDEQGGTSGWMSLYYGEMLPRPTLEARTQCTLPATIVTYIHLV
jgi:asparagine synthase (glutamine-hydrolysing)